MVWQSPDKRQQAFVKCCHSGSRSPEDVPDGPFRLLKSSKVKLRGQTLHQAVAGPRPRETGEKMKKNVSLGADAFPECAVVAGHATVRIEFRKRPHLVRAERGIALADRAQRVVQDQRVSTVHAVECFGQFAEDTSRMILILRQPEFSLMVFEPIEDPRSVENRKLQPSIPRA
jgi:hypothetical protein